MERMVKRARSAAAVAAAKKEASVAAESEGATKDAPPVPTALLSCSCEERRPSPAAGPRAPRRNATDDDGPPGHGCMTVELLSLLLTGEVRSTYRGWSAGGLGVGLLSNEVGEVGRGLTHPLRPVWILKGDACYSTLWLDDENDKPSKTSGARGGTMAALVGSQLNVRDLDLPGSAIRLTHWNPWHSVRSKTTLRVITARGGWNSKEFVPSSTPKCRTVTESILQRRRERQRATALAGADERDDSEDAGDDGQGRITAEEIARVSVHPEDSQYYPGQYRRWRFDMGSTALAAAAGMSEPVEDAKQDAMGQSVPDASAGKAKPVPPTNPEWIPYFRLDGRQRQIVESKLAPRINMILWTRWPRATVDDFQPAGPPHPVV